jgi:pimeloyl-ACP methyl ester carboxylesterase
MAFFEKGPVRIHYQEAGSGFPLFIIPGGGQNSTIGFMSDRAPFNATEEFKNEYRCITADLRNAPSGQSSGPLEVDRPWDSELTFFPWKDTKEKIPLAVRHVGTFLKPA